jgi:hypothetical protein
MDVTTKILSFLNDNAAGLGVVGLFLGAAWGIFTYFFPKKQDGASPTSSVRGGSGGNASVKGNGLAIGGRGGRAGLSGNGGAGGDATVTGHGIAIGGDAGDAAMPWRPGLGGASPLERDVSGGLPYTLLSVDPFGFILPGRGGVAGNENTTVNVMGQELLLVPLLRYLNFWSPHVIDAVDARLPKNSQEFWDIAKRYFVLETERAAKHVLFCQTESIPKGTPAPNPYAP